MYTCKLDITRERAKGSTCKRLVKVRYSSTNELPSAIMEVFSHMYQHTRTVTSP